MELLLLMFRARFAIASSVPVTITTTPIVAMDKGSILDVAAVAAFDAFAAVAGAAGVEAVGAVYDVDAGDHDDINLNIDLMTKYVAMDDATAASIATATNARRVLSDSVGFLQNESTSIHNEDDGNEDDGQERVLNIQVSTTVAIVVALAIMSLAFVALAITSLMVAIVSRLNVISMRMSSSNAVFRNGIATKPMASFGKGNATTTVGEKCCGSSPVAVQATTKKLGLMMNASKSPEKTGLLSSSSNSSSNKEGYKFSKSTLHSNKQSGNSTTGAKKHTKCVTRDKSRSENCTMAISSQINNDQSYNSDDGIIDDSIEEVLDQGNHYHHNRDDTAERDAAENLRMRPSNKNDPHGVGGEDGLRMRDGGSCNASCCSDDSGDDGDGNMEMHQKYHRRQDSNRTKERLKTQRRDLPESCAEFEIDVENDHTIHR